MPESEGLLQTPLTLKHNEKRCLKTASFFLFRKRSALALACFFRSDFLCFVFFSFRFYVLCFFVPIPSSFVLFPFRFKFCALRTVIFAVIGFAVYVNFGFPFRCENFDTKTKKPSATADGTNL